MDGSNLKVTPGDIEHHFHNITRGFVGFDKGRYQTDVGWFVERLVASSPYLCELVRDLALGMKDEDRTERFFAGFLNAVMPIASRFDAERLNRMLYGD